MWAKAALVVQVALTAWYALFMAVGADAAGFAPAESVPLLVAALAMTALISVGVILDGKAPGHPLVVVLTVPWVFTTAYFADIGWVLTADSRGWPGVEAGMAVTALLQMWSSIGILALLFRFPTGRPLGRGWELYLRIAVATVVADALLRTFGPQAGGTPLERPNPLALPGIAQLGPALDVLSALYMVHALAGLACLIVRYRRGTPVERQQLRWIALALAAVVVGVAVTVAPSGVWQLFVLAGGLLLVPVTIGIAVLQHRLWDLGLILRRAIVYALLTGLLLAAYIGLVLLLRILLPGLLPEVLMTAVIAVVALPLRELLQEAFDRLLYGSRRDPYAVVRMLGQRLQAGAEPPLPLAVRELARALRLPYLAIVLPDGTALATVGARPQDGEERLPLRHGAAMVGELAIGRRHPAEPLTPRDHRLLDDLTGHLAAAAHAATLDHKLLAAHARLLAAHQEERSRIQRDLHDELGPLLGAASLRIQAAANLLGTGGHPAELAVAAAGDDLTRAMAEIRRILSDLQPITLAEHGLLAALHQHGSSWAGHLDLHLDLPTVLPVLEPTTEVAAYRIVIEALHNAERHSGGSTVHLKLRHCRDRLEIEVSDDGVGLATATRSGVGLRSMRRRAEQLGGTLSFDTRPSGGLHVRGALPT